MCCCCIYPCLLCVPDEPDCSVEDLVAVNEQAERQVCHLRQELSQLQDTVHRQSEDNQAIQSQTRGLQEVHGLLRRSVMQALHGIRLPGNSATLTEENFSQVMDSLSTHIKTEGLSLEEAAKLSLVKQSLAGIKVV